jgi:hypothetical protein
VDENSAAAINRLLNEVVGFPKVAGDVSIPIAAAATTAVVVTYCYLEILKGVAVLHHIALTACTDVRDAALLQQQHVVRVLHRAHPHVRYHLVHRRRARRRATNGHRFQRLVEQILHRASHLRLRQHCA